MNRILLLAASFTAAALHSANAQTVVRKDTVIDGKRIVEMYSQGLAGRVGTLGLTVSSSISARDTLGILVNAVNPGSPAEKAGVNEVAKLSRPRLLDELFQAHVESQLKEPTFVIDYPVELSPFARPTDDDVSLTERFEYFAGGMELGNAFTEINDAEEQQARFDAQSEHVQGERGDPDYVEALSYGMPPTGGLGLGIDRLTMLLGGRETIRDVILFPTLRPQ